MAVSFNTLKVGEELMDIHSQRMGNTTMSELCKWRVVIKEIDAEGRRALVSWNSNTPQWWNENRLRRLYRKEPKAYRDQQERRAKYGRW